MGLTVLMGNNHKHGHWSIYIRACYTLRKSTGSIPIDVPDPIIIAINQVENNSKRAIWWTFNHIGIHRNLVPIVRYRDICRRQGKIKKTMPGSCVPNIFAVLYFSVLGCKIIIRMPNVPHPNRIKLA